jgi:hypothetical protein
MQDIELYHGDFEDVAELTRRVWLPEYGGKTWVALPDGAFFRWQGSQNGARCVAAYDGTKLIGSTFSFPYSLRIGSSVLPSALISGFTVDPDHRRVALPLLQRLRRHHEDQGIGFSLGVVLSDPTSISCRFWTKYAETFPQNFRFLFPIGYWVKVLAPGRMARAGVKAWERTASRVLGSMLRFTPHRYDPDVRPYGASDLEQCAQILDKASDAIDWALVWSPEHLKNQLESSLSGTFVFERHGRVRGMVNYHTLLLQGRESVRTALIDLWADDGLTGAERIRLLSHLCTDLRERDVHLVMALRCAMMPISAFAGNLFLPTPAQFQMGAFFTGGPISLPLPKTWNLVMM